MTILSKLQLRLRTVPLESILCTEELLHRPRAPDYEKENWRAGEAGERARRFAGYRTADAG